MKDEKEFYAKWIREVKATQENEEYAQSDEVRSWLFVE